MVFIDFHKRIFVKFNFFRIPKNFIKNGDVRFLQ